ncbi:MAG: primosomal protein N' [Chitinophagales bacterium]|nr:primosomal protein N' [Chitinophagales bacterium]
MYVEVVLPFPLADYYTYAVPPEFEDDIDIGKRVIVQFGKSKIYTALVRKIKQTVNPVLRPKAIEDVMDEFPLVEEIHFSFWEWMAEYYMSTPGELMNAALPSAFKLSSESHFILIDHAIGRDHEYKGEAATLIEALQYQEKLGFKEIQSLLGKKNIYHVIRSLIEGGVITSFETLQEKYKPRLVSIIKQGEVMVSSDLEEVFESLNKAPRQVEGLMHFIELSRGSGYCLKSKLIKSSGIGSSIVKSMVNKGILIEEHIEVSRLKDYSNAIAEDPELSDFQQEAMDQIEDQFADKRVVLIHGVTSSGKTHIYIEQIKKCLAEGKQVLYLLPEIALTAQIVNRLRKVFGDKVGLYHSKFSDNERIEIWDKVKKNEFSIVLGARSAIFLPFDDLDLVIIDEEHDRSFKQFDPSPRYNARDAAIVLAQIFDAKVLMGTATPSFESFYNARKKKYGLVTMDKRFGEIHLPLIEIVDLKEQYHRKLIRSNISSVLYDDMQHSLSNGEQVILFQNRRGYAPMLSCDTCGWIPECKRCDVSLTYHKFADSMICHLCGFRSRTYQKCQACGSSTLVVKGFGTEKIESDLSILFPKANIGRLDYDSARGKYDHEKIIHSFENKEIDILVGTQMVSKGLDFDNVSLVGVIHADQLLYFPDFRANERAFQLIAQVAGRSGRKKKRGKVVIQTFSVNHHVLKYILQNDFISFYKDEMLSRNSFKYPPANRLILLSVKHKKFDVVDAGASLLYKQLIKTLDLPILGPTIPNISRIRNQYIRDILIKLPGKGNSVFVKEKIRNAIESLKKVDKVKSVQVQINVDP